jgi:glycosyltransferase involved in cell wall biosynthesis
VGIAARRVAQIYNGVDVQRFQPAAASGVRPIPGCPFEPSQHLIVGAVGRLQAEKDPLTLVRAFAQAVRMPAGLGARLRLVLVGDGPLRDAVAAEVAALGLQGQVWMAGVRGDVPAVLQGLHVFALPSRAEGISNTILEAMACGLPVLATAVGGNPELVLPGETGLLVPPADPGAMAEALVQLADGPRAQALGQAGRQRVEQHFSLQAMVGAYQQLYDQLLAQRTGAA